MSSSNNNNTYKKTSFLAGNNSEFINEFYADYIADPYSLPDSWRKFFAGLSDDEKLVYEDLKGPSWSPAKKIKKPTVIIANTIKGKGVSFMEKNIKWHSGIPSEEEYDLALNELNEN